MPPTLLNNRYRILRTLGSGSFGETFLAEDTHMPSSRQCAIKKLKLVTDNPEVYQLVQERFAREAAILESLGEGHPQIPKLYAYFSEADRFYLVQEFIEGQTLSNWRKQQQPISENAVKEILINILPVLVYIHSKGIVHRDIKPDNIILRTSDNKPVLIDFGAVRETMGTVINVIGTNQSSIIIGTPGFMPSEQAAGRPVYSSDLYSLGLTAIYLLTGKNPQHLAMDHHTGEIIWHEQATQISPSFAAVLDRAIKNHPRERIPSAQSMLEALQSNSQPIEATIPIVQSQENTPLPETNIDQTVAVVQENNQTKNTKNIILASSIIGGLVSASLVVGLMLNQKSPSNFESRITTETVQFQSGTTDKTMSGTVATGEIKHYILSSRRGQQFQVQILRGDINISVIAPDGQKIGDAINGNKQWQGLLPMNGDYIVEISSPQNSTSDYALNIDISTPNKPDVLTKRVRFNPGSTGATLRGLVGPNKIEHHLLKCMEGQQFGIQILQGEINFTVTDPTGRIIGGGGNGNDRWFGILPSTGDYTVEISSPNLSKYAVNIEVK